MGHYQCVFTLIESAERSPNLNVVHGIFQTVNAFILISGYEGQQLRHDTKVNILLTEYWNIISITLIILRLLQHDHYHSEVGHIKKHSVTDWWREMYLRLTTTIPLENEANSYGSHSKYVSFLQLLWIYTHTIWSYSHEIAIITSSNGDHNAQ